MRPARRAAHSTPAPLLIPAAVLLTLPFLALWGSNAFYAAWIIVGDHMLITLGVVVVGVVVVVLLDGEVKGREGVEQVLTGLEDILIPEPVGVAAEGGES